MVGLLVGLLLRCALLIRVGHGVVCGCFRVGFEFGAMEVSVAFFCYC